ncbi:uncharacterized protein [Mytilus edulis]|uniref:uncharacterized protein n=1 Tax=Mytilus edulis TaxID=6550 RepID=UPI0039EFB76A
MLKLGGLTFFVVCFVNGQLTDKTRTPNASGSDVVEAVVNLIREACIFPNDKLYLRRLAYVESMDGLEANTYRPNYYGGIWQIDQDMFQQIATAIVLDDAKKMITQRIGIDRSKVQWIDLAKPLYSGLAAALFTLLKAGKNGIPRGIHYQANFWVNTYRPGHLANVFFTKSNKLETGCKRTNTLDLVFALDSSTSLAPQEFDAAKQFVKSIVDSFEISSDKTQVGVIRFSTTVDGGFNLNTHSSADELKKAIDGVQYKSGGTHTAEAIEYAINNLFTTTNGARLGSSKILILVTDGRSENRNETLRQAAAAKAKGISIFAIGVSAQVDERELNAVASQPTCTHVKILNSFDDLDSLKAEMEQVSCKAPDVLTPNKYVYGCNSDVAVQIIQTKSNVRMILSLYLKYSHIMYNLVYQTQASISRLVRKEVCLFTFLIIFTRQKVVTLEKDRSNHSKKPDQITRKIRILAGHYTYRVSVRIRVMLRIKVLVSIEFRVGVRV